MHARPLGVRGYSETQTMSDERDQSDQPNPDQAGKSGGGTEADAGVGNEQTNVGSGGGNIGGASQGGTGGVAAGAGRDRDDQAGEQPTTPIEDVGGGGRAGAPPPGGTAEPGDVRN
jgi:hypothetical protein